MSAGVRSGYKQAEVGVIPVDWEHSAIGDVADIRVVLLSQFAKPCWQDNQREER